MNTPMIQLVVGLGNPSPTYEGTRHNLGRAIIEQFLVDAQRTTDNAQTVNIPSFRGHAYKLKTANGTLTTIVVPDLGTYMNTSGPAVQKLLSFFNIDPTDLVLVHDDIDLPLGTVRVSTNASSAGHNGVQSVIDAVGTQNFTRIRLGVETRTDKQRPPAEDFVLQKFSDADAAALALLHQSASVVLKETLTKP